MTLLIKILAVLPILVLLVIGINQLIFKYRTPAKYANSNWAGKWGSSSVPIIKGKMRANLPTELPINEEFEAEVMIYYNIWSLFRMGGINEFTLTGSLGNDNLGGGESQVNESESGGRLLQFKAKIFSESGQKLDYSGITDKGKWLIVGGYKSMHPNDLGNFELKRLK